MRAPVRSLEGVLAGTREQKKRRWQEASRTTCRIQDEILGPTSPDQPCCGHGLQDRAGDHALPIEDQVQAHANGHDLRSFAGDPAPFPKTWGYATRTEPSSRQTGTRKPARPRAVANAVMSGASVASNLFSCSFQVPKKEDNSNRTFLDNREIWPIGGLMQVL